MSPQMALQRGVEMGAGHVTAHVQSTSYRRRLSSKAGVSPKVTGLAADIGTRTILLTLYVLTKHN